MSTREEIADIVHGSRQVHEMMLRASEIDATAGTCLYASFALCMSLEKFGGRVAVIRGGDGQADGGARDDAGKWHGHYWVEGVTPDGVAFAADVTADQFGHPPVYFDRLDLSRSRYVPGSDENVEAAVASLGENVAATVYCSGTGIVPPPSIIQH